MKIMRNKLSNTNSSHSLNVYKMYNIILCIMRNSIMRCYFSKTQKYDFIISHVFPFPFSAVLASALQQRSRGIRDVNLKTSIGCRIVKHTKRQRRNSETMNGINAMVSYVLRKEFNGFTMTYRVLGWYKSNLKFLFRILIDLEIH